MHSWLLFRAADVFSGGTHMMHGDGSPVALFTSAAIAVVIIIGAAVIASLLLL
jgi:hypothetical protein